MELSNDFRVSVPPQQAWDVLTDVERIAPLLPGAQLQEIEGDDYRGVVKVKVGPITAQYKGTATFLERDQAGGRMVLKAVGRDTRGQGNANATITATMKPDGEGTAVTVVTDLTITGKVAQFGRGVLADVSGKLITQFVDALEKDLSKAPTAPTTASGAPAAPAAAPSAASAPTPAASTPAASPAAAAPAAAPSSAAAPLVGEPAASGEAPATAAEATPAAPAAATEAASEAAAAVPGVVAGGPAGPGATAPLPEGAAATTPTPGIRRIDSPEVEPLDLLDAAGGSVTKRLVPALGVVGALLVVLALRRRAGRRRRGLARVAALAPIASVAPAVTGAAHDVVATGRRAGKAAARAARR